MSDLVITPEDFERYEFEINMVQAEEQKDIDNFWEGFLESFKDFPSGLDKYQPTKDINSEEFKVYHVPGVKIGCTNDWPKRVIDQGYNPEDCEILFSSDDGWEAGDKEIELQKQYGYRVDKCHYMKSREARRIGGKKGAKIAGKNGGKIAGKIAKVRGQLSELGKISQSIERTCPHCRLTMKGSIYFRFHDTNCKMNPNGPRYSGK